MCGSGPPSASRHAVTAVTLSPTAPGDEPTLEHPVTTSLSLVGPQGQLLDLLGARLQFEQNAVHLYDALIAKLDADLDGAAGPSHADLAAIRNDELSHVRLLERLIDQLGGEPAAITPAASRETIAGRGIGEIVTDPHSSVLDALEAIVIAELIDNEQWVGLIELARELDHEDVAHSCLTAQSTEHKHLARMRVWISALRAATRSEVV